MALSKKIRIKESDASNQSSQEVDAESTELSADGQLTVDVYETTSDFVVLSTVAGISAKDVEIVIDKDMLVIKGNRPNPEGMNNISYFYQECYWGPFSRKIILPENVDGSQAEADFNKGLLTIRFPKNSAKIKKDISVKEV